MDRDCAEPDPSDPTRTQCGFTFAGDCADYTPVIPSPYACAKLEPTAGFYLKCHAVSGLGTWPQARPYTLVVTTYVKP